MKYWHLFVLCIYTCISHPVIYLQINNDTQIAQIFQRVSQDFIYEQTHQHRYTIFHQYFSISQQLKQQYNETLQKATYIISFVESEDQMQFYEIANFYNVPILTFFTINPSEKYQKKNCYVIDTTLITNQSNSTQFQKIKKYIRDFIQQNQNELKPKTNILRQSTFTKAQNQQNLKQTPPITNFTIAIYVVAGQGSGGWWTWTKNIITISKLIGKPRVAFKFLKQRIPFKQLRTYDIIIMQNPVYTILQQMPFQMRRRTYIGPFALNHPFDNEVKVKQKHTIRELLNGTNIIIEVGGNNLKEKCTVQKRDAIIDCIAFEQGINPNQWVPIHQKQQRVVPLVYYKQRPQNETPRDLRHALSNYMLNNLIFHYQVLITKRKYNIQENIVYTIEQFKQLLMKTNYMISFSSYGSYQNFMYETWSCDVPLISFWFNPIEYFEDKAGQRIKIDKQKVPQGLVKDNMDKFLKKFNEGFYTPRQQILKYHNINNQAKLFLEKVENRFKQIGYKHKKDIIN